MLERFALILNPLSRLLGPVWPCQSDGACMQALPRQANSLPLSHWVGSFSGQLALSASGAFKECPRNRKKRHRTRFGIFEVSTKRQNALNRVRLKVFSSVLCICLCLGQMAGAASIDAKTRGMLDFIGSIEGPAGYDDYYRGVSSGPPQPLSTMTVSEVLDWQDSVDKSSKSEAAGRYQIMEDTLRGLVNSGAADPNARFDQATQDELATKLLKRRGWDPDSTNLKKMCNAIAYEWAALPRCSGIKEGRSAYDGIAGNSAQTSTEAFLEVIRNGNDPAAVAWALSQSAIGTSGTGGVARVNNAFDKFMRTYKNTFYDLSEHLTGIATRLLLALLIIEWIWATAMQVGNGVGIGKLMSSLITRILIGGLFLFIINLGNFSDLVIRSADSLLSQTTSGATINVVDLFDLFLQTAFKLLSSWSFFETIIALPVFLLGVIIVGLIVIGYLETYLMFAAAVIALGFGSFSKTRHIAISYLKRCVGRVFNLFVVLFTGAISSVLIKADINAGIEAPMTLIGMLIILIFVALTAPRSVEQAVTGRAAASVGERLGMTTMSVLGNFAVSMPKKLLRMIGVPFVK